MFEVKFLVIYHMTGDKGKKRNITTRLVQGRVQLVELKGTREFESLSVVHTKLSLTYVSKNQNH